MVSFEWNCSQCTFLHKFPGQRCQMCGALRVSRDEMRNFVLGKPIGNNSGNSSSSAAETASNTAVGGDAVAAVSNERGDNPNTYNSGNSSQSYNLPRVPQHQNQSTKPVNPYNKQRPNSCSGFANSAKPTSSYVGPTSSGRVKNPYARPNSTGGRNSSSASSTSVSNERQGKSEPSLPYQHTITQQINTQNVNQTEQNTTLSNPYYAASSYQSIARDDSGPANPYTDSKPISHQQAGNQQQQMTPVPRQSSAQFNNDTFNHHNKLRNGVDQSQFNRKTTSGQEVRRANYNSQHNEQNGMNQSIQSSSRSYDQYQNNRHNSPSHPISQNNQLGMNHNRVNVELSNPINQNQQAATAQGLKETSIAPIFQPGRGAASSKTDEQSAPYGMQNSNLKSPWNKRLPYQEGPVPLSETTRHNWIFPTDDKYPERSYQLQMSHTSIMTNTLVSLPTGLGKTLIAAVVMYNYYRWFPMGKVVFCAPTRPLVTQQIKACYEIMGIPERHTAEISGKSKPDVRQRMWDAKRVFFCTPQTVVSDIEGGRCNARDIVCVVMDEAHKATGNHANTQLINLIRDAGAKFRLVGLSATPGTDIKSIQKVITTLGVCHIEAKTEDDPDVKQYINRRLEEVIIVEPPTVVSVIDKLFGPVMQPWVETLNRANAGYNGSLHYTVKPFTVHMAKEAYLKRTGDHSLDGFFAALHHFAGIRNKLYVDGLRNVRRDLYDLQLAQQPKPGLLGAVRKRPEFQTLIREVIKASSNTQDDDLEASEDLMKNNPKYEKLHEILLQHFERKQASSQDTRVIIFSQFRDSVDGIVGMLKGHKHHMLKPSAFIGQSKKSGGKKSNARDADSGGQDLAGMNQKQQQDVLKKFNEGHYNILVCTSVAEEGLDIGEVDLIVNFDVLKSPIRSIQRSGRTGRKRDGRVVFLVSKGVEERSYNESIANKRKIARALKSNRSTFQFCDIVPMFPVEPVLLRQKMNKPTFRMSQIGGHTPKGKANAKSSRSNQSKSDWVLTFAEETERQQQFGELPDFLSYDLDNPRCFPQSLRHDYIKSRGKSKAIRPYLSDGKSRHTPPAGSCLSFLRDFERKHLSESNTFSLSPFGKESSQLQNIQNSSNDVISLNSDDASVVISDSSMLYSPNCPSFDDGSLGENPLIEEVDEDPLDAIFGVSIRDNRCTEITDSQVSLLFDSDDHKNCAVTPPPGCKGVVSTDSDSENEESISARSRSSQLSLNTQNDDLLCDFFERKGPSVPTTKSTANKESIQVFDIDDEVNFGGDCAFGYSFDENDAVQDQCNISDQGETRESATANDVFHPTANSANAETAAADVPCSLPKHNPSTSKESKQDMTVSNDRNEVLVSNSITEKKCLNSTSTPTLDISGNLNHSAENRKHPLFFESDLTGEELTSMERERSSSEAENDSIVALQLPTPPDTSEESDNVSMADDSASQNVCLNDESGIMFDTSRMEKIVVDEGQAQIQSTSSAALEVEETCESGHIEPLQLPTQYSSSSDDESECEEDDDSSLTCDAKANLDNKDPDRDRTCANVHEEVDSSHQDKDFDLDVSNDPAQPSFELGGINNNVPDSSFESEDVVQEAEMSFEDIVPLQLPTQYSSSEEEESDDEASQAQDDGAAIVDFTPQTDVYIDLCDENDDEDSAAKMPPPLSLKNITNVAQQMSSPDDLVDTPIPKRVNLKSASPDDLTDTPIHEERKLSVHPRLSEGLTDTPIKTTEKKKAPKKLAGGRKRLRAAVDEKENKQTAAAAISDRQERVKKRIEEKYRCRFLDTEAALDGSDEESDEEDAIRQIEEDESDSSFINDSSQLGYTQDDLDHLNADQKIQEGNIDPEDSLLHRQFNHERNISEQFKTPVFNRRMMRDSLSQNVPSSQRGLGNMNFIKSVLEHHRRGGDSDDIENEYHRLVGDSPCESQETISIVDSPPRLNPQQNRQEALQQQQQQQQQQQSNYSVNQQPRYMNPTPTNASMPRSPPSHPPALTAEQKAMIEAKRAAALKRRHERMQQLQQQAQSTVRANPYSK